MKTLMESSIIVSVLFLIDAYFEQKKKFLYYILLFLTMYGICYLGASEPDLPDLIECFEQEAMIVPPNIKFEKAKVRIEVGNRFGMYRSKSKEKKDRKYYERKVKKHDEDGDRSYKNAVKKTWFIPQLDDREKAKYCLTTAVTSAIPGDPRAKVISCALQLFLQYGLDCMDEWNYIQNQLNWASYHYEMADFYREVIREYF